MLVPIKIINKFLSQLFSFFKENFDHNIIKIVNSIELTTKCCSISSIYYTPFHNKFNFIITEIFPLLYF